MKYFVDGWNSFSFAGAGHFRINPGTISRVKLKEILDSNNK